MAQIKTEVKENVGYLIFHNPDRRNALTKSMWKELPAKMDALNTNPQVRVILMRGTGDKVFTAGADISEFAEVRQGAAAKEYSQYNTAAFKAIKSSAKPVVAVIHGFCFGGGMALASFCDIRLASDDARFCIPAAKLGLGFDQFIISQVIEIVGAAAARDMIFSARVIDAAAAASLGFLQQVIPKSELDQTGFAYAQTIANNAPLTIKAAKAAINDWLQPESVRNPETVKQLTQECYDSEDYDEGFNAFLEKRPAKFQGK